jgi:demethylmenaquinone methyltransferase/2-methoxy-6-polyprenyl-1,4-benzoquinol methylase
LSSTWDETVGNNDENRMQKLRDAFSFIRLKPGATVIDAGCGTGILFPFIEERIGAEGKLIAVDAAGNMIEEAKKKHAAYANVQYIASTLEHLVLPHNIADAIICFAVFPHIEDKSAALMQCRRLLKENGALYIFHLSDTESLNAFHHTLDAPVRNDTMPHRSELESLFSLTGFIMARYIDQPELNFIEANAV